jgi:hypothetical protein
LASEGGRLIASSLSPFFDDSLYKTDPETSNEANFIDRLLIAQLGNPQQSVVPAPILDRFALDGLKVVTGGGTAQTQSAISDALLVAAMEYYYFNTPSTTTEFFNSAYGALNFEFSDIDFDSTGSTSKSRPDS